MTQTGGQQVLTGTRGVAGVTVSSVLPSRAESVGVVVLLGRITMVGSTSGWMTPGL